jgi:hypothetical protein
MVPSPCSSIPWRRWEVGSELMDRIYRWNLLISRSIIFVIGGRNVSSSSVVQDVLTWARGIVSNVVGGDLVTAKTIRVSSSHDCVGRLTVWALEEGLTLLGR